MRDKLSPSNWLYQQIIVEKFNNIFGFILLALISAAIAVGISMFGIKFGTTILVIIIGIPFVVYSMVNPRFGLLMLIFSSTFTAFLNRVLRTNIPFGIGMDSIIIITFLGVVYRYVSKNEFDKTALRNPITIVGIVWVVYLLMEVANPEGTFAAWLFGTREILRFVMLYLIGEHIFKSLKDVHVFTKLWLFVVFITAMYGLYQEYAGLPSYDLRWATLTEERINLLFIQQKWRKWSFLGDPAFFGLFMYFGGVVALILALGPFDWKKRIILGVSGIIILFAMLFSGTRTAFGIVPIAFCLYVFLNLNKFKTLAFAIIAAVVFVVLIFGPFHNKTLVRLRSAFNPGEDASMNLRDINRERIQPYIYRHPIGGGFSVTGDQGMRFAPRHYLAGWPTDSGYMKTALEVGWIGLAIKMTLFATVMIIGVSNYYRVRDPIIKSYYSAFLAGFFGLCVALYSKNNVEQFPLNCVLYGNFVLMYRLRKFDIEITEAQKLT